MRSTADWRVRVCVCHCETLPRPVSRSKRILLVGGSGSGDGASKRKLRAAVGVIEAAVFEEAALEVVGRLRVPSSADGTGVCLLLAGYGH